jgi:hypothetical protein
VFDCFSSIGESSDRPFDFKFVFGGSPALQLPKNRCPR